MTEKTERNNKMRKGTFFDREVAIIPVLDITISDYEFYLIFCLGCTYLRSI